MAKILIVDDEEKIRFVVKEYAQFSGYEVAEANDGAQALEICKNQTIDLIVMDVMMPGVDGFSAVKEIRKFSPVPVIMLSARGEEYDKLFGFELGIDDYVVKPFSPKELMARIAAVLARGKATVAARETMQFGGLFIDVTGRTVTVDGVPAQMTPKEYELLFYMAKNKGIALSRERLITEVWGYDYFGDDRTLDTHIKMLRQNLGPYRGYIVTLRSMGYKFEA
ncbi:MAG: response regulator transcription factor [Oscillospiraceae bacterium]|nr:response regulator transcription factor [Oscillospiraceae bacterium]MBP1556514.1 response regulator transcription factor [Oscillospiraceae bacterium]